AYRSIGQRAEGNREEKETKAEREMPNWELKHCCDHDQSVFIVTIAVFTVVILAVSSSSPKLVASWTLYRCKSQSTSLLSSVYGK
ncbi:hypothetical protein GW17_00022903, partial [Ensete ventricosum]